MGPKSIKNSKFHALKNFRTLSQMKTNAKEVHFWTLKCRIWLKLWKIEKRIWKEKSFRRIASYLNCKIRSASSVCKKKLKIFPKIWKIAPTLRCWKKDCKKFRKRPKDTTRNMLTWESLHTHQWRIWCGSWTHLRKMRYKTVIWMSTSNFLKKNDVLGKKKSKKQRSICRIYRSSFWNMTWPQKTWSKKMRSLGQNYHRGTKLRLKFSNTFKSWLPRIKSCRISWIRFKMDLPEQNYSVKIWI